MQVLSELARKSGSLVHETPFRVVAVYFLSMREKGAVESGSIGA